jgi:hypothetical protein
MPQGNYVLVENGAVVWGPGELPRSWKNVSGLNMMESAELKELGWLPWREVLSPYDNKTHYRDGYNHDIQTEEVVYTDIIRAFTVDQLEQNTWNDWSTDMLNSDDWVHASIHLPRQLEDIITMLISKYPDILNEEGNEIIKKRYNDKKALRATKPSNPNE